MCQRPCPVLRGAKTNFNRITRPRPSPVKVFQFKLLAGAGDHLGGYLQPTGLTHQPGRSREFCSRSCRAHFFLLLELEFSPLYMGCRTGAMHRLCTLCLCIAQGLLIGQQSTMRERVTLSAFPLAPKKDSDVDVMVSQHGNCYHVAHPISRNSSHSHGECLLNSMLTVWSICCRPVPI